MPEFRHKVSSDSYLLSKELYGEKNPRSTSVLLINEACYDRRLRFSA
jgi:hypothetical protein